jgi:hypothetical protein
MLPSEEMVPVQIESSDPEDRTLNMNAVQQILIVAFFEPSQPFEIEGKEYSPRNIHTQTMV